MKKVNLNRTGAHVVLTIRIIAVSLLILCLLSFTKLPRMLAFIESKKRQTHIEDAQLQYLVHKINQIARYKYFLIRNNCLRKSLLLYYFLIQSGVKDIRINIGINKENNKLAGHSWLTLGGSVFQDSEAFISKYAVIYSSGVS